MCWVKAVPGLYLTGRSTPFVPPATSSCHLSSRSYSSDLRTTLHGCMNCDIALNGMLYAKWMDPLATKQLFWTKRTKKKDWGCTHSWLRIFLGKSTEESLPKRVLDSISMKSALRCTSSPCFPPEAKWQHTKQKLVSCRQNLRDTEPCMVSAQLKSFSSPSHELLLASCFRGRKEGTVYLVS